MNVTAAAVIELIPAMTTPTLKAPIPYFGGKSTITPAVWLRLGRVKNYCEPLAGSLAVLLGAPLDPGRIETVNDLNGWVCNMWRAIAADPDAVAYYADWPVSEIDLHARGDYIFFSEPAKGFIENMRSDPDFYDAKFAGWYMWGMSSWIGNFGEKTYLDDAVWKRVNYQLPHLSAVGNGINRKRPKLSGYVESGVNRDNDIYGYMRQLQARLRRVRVCCGDWRRVLTPSVTTGHGLTAVFLDPPYSSEAKRDNVLYGKAHESTTLAHDVRAWGYLAHHWAGRQD